MIMGMTQLEINAGQQEGNQDITREIVCIQNKAPALKSLRVVQNGLVQKSQSNVRVYY